MSGIIFWLVIGLLFLLLWWAGFYATKDMRVRKNAMREEQAKKNLAQLAKGQTDNESAGQEKP